MILPILLSLPHAGLKVPPEAQPFCRLTPEEIIADSDEGGAEDYDLRDHVAELVTTDVARSIVDLNRAEDDRRKDGVVKTNTCWDVPVYHTFPPPGVIQSLLDRYHRPYHAKLSALAGTVRMGVDCHTMSAVAPPAAPDTGQQRPAVCLGDVNGTSLPAGWSQLLVRCLEDAFSLPIALNKPFSGGYITRRHSCEMPWVQIELSRAAFCSHPEKRNRVLAALKDFCGRVP